MLKFTLLFSCLLCLGNICLGQVYVALPPLGSDVTGNGTQLKPYATIQRGVNAVMPGGTVLIDAGEYKPTIGISVGKPLTLKKWRGNEVVINASDIAFSLGNPYVIVIVNTQNVTLDSLTIKNAIFQEAKGIWILDNQVNGPNVRNITIRHCTLYNIGWISNDLKKRPPTQGYGTNAVRVDCKNSNAMSGVKLINNHIYNCATGWGEAVTLTGNIDSFNIEKNEIHHIANIGIVTAGNYNYTGAPLLLNQSRNGFIRSNKVYNCMSGRATSAGIHIDGALNCTIEKNELFNNGAGISLAAEEAIPVGVIVGNHRVNNNLVYNNSIAGMAIGSKRTDAFVQNCRIYNNTFYRNVTADTINGVDSIGLTESLLQTVAYHANGSNGDILMSNCSDTIFLQNNIIYPRLGRHALTGMSSYTAQNFITNSNLYYRNDATPLYWIAPNHTFNGIFGGSTGNGIFYNDLGQIISATGQELNGCYGNPVFNNVATNNFALTQCSYAIDRGNSQYNSFFSDTTDYAGIQRRFNNIRLDCGAYEWQSATTPCLFNIISATPQCNSNTSQVTVKWQSAGSALSYDVYTDPGNILRGNVADTQFVHTPLTASSSYTYKIIAKNNSGNTQSSNTIGPVFALNCSPAGSFSLADTAECTGATSSIRLNWTASANASGYKVYRNAVAISGNLTALQFIDASVTAGSSYNYKVDAFSLVDTISNSNTLPTIIALNCLQPGTFNLNPPLPECNDSKSQVKVSWTQAPNATFYDLYRNGGATPFRANLTGTQYIDTSVLAGSNYTYLVNAKNNNSGLILANANGSQDTIAINCTVTGINNMLNNPFEIKVFPVPAGDFVELSAKKVMNTTISLDLYDAQGALILSIPATRMTTEIYSRKILLTRLAAGSYLLRIKVNKSAYYKELIKK